MPPARYFSFHVAPATLVFVDVRDLEGEIDASDPELVIDGIERSDDDPPLAANSVRRWLVFGDAFELSFQARGFRQHFRRRPVFTGTRQRLSADERGAVVSFDCPDVI